MLTNKERLEARLENLSCPICSGKTYQVDPRTDASTDMYYARCVACRYAFPIHTDVELFVQSQPDITEYLRCVPCQSCDQRGVILNCRVQLSVRDMFYLVTCRHCEREFHEKAFMDVYE